MVNLGIVPNWFLGYDVALELLFFLVTLAVSWFSFKVYKLSDQEGSKLFSNGFFLIALGYLAFSATNWIVKVKADMVSSELKLLQLRMFQIAGTYVYMLLFLVGLLTLTYMTLKGQDWKTYTLLLFLVLISFTFVEQVVHFFYLTSAVFLLYLLWFYIQNYRKKADARSLRIMLAFGFLFLGRTQFIFAKTHELFYPLGHLLEMIAYCLILVSLIRVIRK